MVVSLALYVLLIEPVQFEFVAESGGCVAVASVATSVTRPNASRVVRVQPSAHMAELETLQAPMHPPLRLELEVVVIRPISM